MKNNKLWLGLMVMLILSGLTLTGCPQEEPAEKTYTVWTYSMSYSEFSSSIGTLNDGYYRKFELSDAEFNGMKPSDQYKHEWTEDEIYNWFLGRDFISSEANELKAWVITSSHCWLASRSGGTVYNLIK
jgi:hypothetical protein